MENNEKRKASLMVKKDNSYLSAIKTGEDVEKLVDFIATSEIYNSKFLVNRTQDGKTERVVDRSAIATCLMLGAELGFKPMESIMLGNRLDGDSVVKVYRGRDLGLSPMTSLHNIYVFKGQNNQETVYTNIHVVNKCLTDAGVKRRVIDDGTKPYFFHVLLDENLNPTNIEIDYDENFHISLNSGIDTSIIEKAMASGKKPVIRKHTKRGLVELTRGAEVIAIPFTLIQAVEAGLYPGVNSFGETVKGKTNWANHPAVHLVKQSTMIGARMLIGDILQGSIYLDTELPVNEIEDTDAEPLN